MVERKSPVQGADCSFLLLLLEPGYVDLDLDLFLVSQEVQEGEGIEARIIFPLDTTLPPDLPLEVQCPIQLTPDMAIATATANISPLFQVSVPNPTAIHEHAPVPVHRVHPFPHQPLPPAAAVEGRCMR